MKRNINLVKKNMKKLENSSKNNSHVQVKNVYQNLKINLKIHQRHIHNSMEHPRGSIFTKIVNE